MLGAMTVDTLLATHSDSSLEVATSRGAEALHALLPEWQRLAGAAAEPMQSPHWALAAARSLHAGAELVTLTVRRGGALVAMMTLAETRRGAVRWLVIPGADALGEPLRPLIADAEARTALCDALLGLRRPLSLPRIDDAEFAAQLRAAARGRAGVFAMSGGASLIATLDGDQPGVLERCSPARQKVLRRNRRQLAHAGDIAFETLVPAPHEVAAALRAAFEVEARSWKGAAGSAVLARPAMFDFFRAYGEACAAEGRLLVRLLKVGERVAAVGVAVIESGRSFDLKIGYDAAFARHSPGLTLTCEALADSARRGLAAHEFLGFAEGWQRPFATRERNFTSLMIYPMNIAGSTAFGFDAAGALLRRTRRALGIS